MEQYVENEDLQLVVFTVGESEFAIYISFVREIINVSRLVTLPEMSKSMVGIIDVRGTVVPVVDLSLRFAWDQSKREETAVQKILLAELDGSLIGFLVGSVTEVLRVSKGSIDESSTINYLGAGLILGICNLKERLIPIVNPDRLLTEREVEHMDNLVRGEFDV